MVLELDTVPRIIAGIVLLTVVTIEFGGLFLLHSFRPGWELTDFQRSFFRAGHAHAGVLVIFGLLCLVLSSATALTGVGWFVAATGVLIAAILMPAGFFFSAMGRGRTAPSRWIALLFAGALSLAAGVVTLGIGLLAA